MNLISTDIERYCIHHSTRPSALAAELQAFTQQSVHGSNMLIGEMEASVITFLMRLANVKRVLEFGTYTGYSALIMAEQLPSEGELITIDINPHTTKIAQEFWDRSPHGKKIRQILKPGLEAMKEIQGEFDLVFIDADKNNYSNYLEWSLKHLSPKGLIIVDNVLWSGKVLQETEDKQTQSIQAHNQKVAALDGLIKTLLPVRDGMFLIQRG